MGSQNSDSNHFIVHRWWLKLTLCLTTGALAYLLSGLTGFSFSFTWYVLGLGLCLLILFAWAAVELWKDYGPRRN